MIVVLLFALSGPSANTIAQSNITPQLTLFQIFLPWISNNYDSNLERVLNNALSVYPQSKGFNPRIEQINKNPDWALAIVNLNVSMSDLGNLHSLSIVYLIARLDESGWKTATEFDSYWLDWISQAPDAILHKSLREYLLTEYSASVLDENDKKKYEVLADLKLPWLPKNNPQFISGYLYNEGTHINSDKYAMDWGLRDIEVVAVASGVVTDLVCDLPNKTDPTKGYGNYVQMDIGNNVRAIYAHLQRCDVTKNVWYPQGTILGVSGTSGYSTGAHLHFRLRNTSYQSILAEPISGYASISKGILYYSNNGIQQSPTGKLQVVQNLVLSNQFPNAGESVRASFTVRNIGNASIILEQLTAGGRRGVDWNGEAADFPGVYNVVLQPGQEYAYSQVRSFDIEGGYFAEPVVKTNGNWGGIANANRVNFTILNSGRLQVVEALNLSTTSPLVGQIVQARFKIKNVGNRNVSIEQLTAGGRRGETWNGEWADFPSVFSLTLVPGQEYIYQQQRSFTVEGGYFSEPVVKIAGQWGGINSANRVTFSVASQGRLQVVESLALSTVTPTSSDTVIARFKVKNVGSKSVLVDQLSAGGRRGDNWDGEWADFPSVFALTLAPEQEYVYEQKRSFVNEGNYFSEPVVKLNGQWGGISNANRVGFTVVSGGRLQISDDLVLSTNSPTSNQTLKAHFKIKNVGTRSIFIEQLTAGGRRGTSWDGDWADFPSVYSVALVPGQEISYDQERSFTLAGNYFAEPVVRLNGNWGGISGANRVAFSVHEGGRLQVVQGLQLNSTTINIGDMATAKFTVRNIGQETLFIDQLVAGGRKGIDWNGDWADFPSVYSINLTPGQEYAYNQNRDFAINGDYFAEPVVKLNGNWGGIEGANRINFIVVPGGRLQMIESLSLQSLSPGVGETIFAHFKIKNVGNRAISLEQLAAVGRKGSNWSGEWADFPSVYGITLQPGQEYSYDQSRVFIDEGDYFVEPQAKINGTWGGVQDGNRLSYTVGPGIRVVTNVYLTPANPRTNQNIVAQFRVKNTSDHSIKIQRFLAAGRGPNCSNWECGNFADFPASPENILLQPYQEYIYSETRQFDTVGAGYFVEPLMLTPNGWLSMPGGSRVSYVISP